MARGAVAKLVEFQTLRTEQRRPGFTVWPAQANGTAFAQENNGTEYFLNSMAAAEAVGTGMARQIALWSLKNTNSLNTGNPNLTLSVKTLGSEAYGVPPWSEQKSGPVPLRDCLATACLGDGPSNEVEGPLDSLDSRMLQVWYANGRVYGSLGTIMTVNGEVQSGIAWFAVATPAGTLAAQGYIGATGQNLLYPSMAVTPDNRGAIALTLTGRGFFPSAAYVHIASMTPSGPVRVVAAGKGPQDGFSEYAFYNAPDPIRPRWGDYGAAVTSGNTIWIASEYINQTCKLGQFTSDPTCGGTRGALGNWGTRITRIH
jgi:hypothetical protein